MPEDRPARAAALPDIHPRQKALLCARLAVEKKAYEVTVLNIGSLTSIAEYFVICSGKSVRQTRAISDHVRAGLKKIRHKPLGIEGEPEGAWILLDCDDVVVHVFHEPTREHYALEKLWSDAPVIGREEYADAGNEPTRPPHAGDQDDDWGA